MDFPDSSYNFAGRASNSYIPASTAMGANTPRIAYGKPHVPEDTFKYLTNNLFVSHFKDPNFTQDLQRMKEEADNKIENKLKSFFGGAFFKQLDCLKSTFKISFIRGLKDTETLKEVTDIRNENVGDRFSVTSSTAVSQENEAHCSVVGSSSTDVTNSPISPLTFTKENIFPLVSSTTDINEDITPDNLLNSFQDFDGCSNSSFSEIKTPIEVEKPLIKSNAEGDTPDFFNPTIKLSDIFASMVRDPEPAAEIPNECKLDESDKDLSRIIENIMESDSCQDLDELVHQELEEAYDVRTKETKTADCAEPFSVAPANSQFSLFPYVSQSSIDERKKINDEISKMLAELKSQAFQKTLDDTLPFLKNIDPKIWEDPKSESSTAKAPDPSKESPKDAEVLSKNPMSSFMNPERPSDFAIAKESALKAVTQGFNDTSTNNCVISDKKHKKKHKSDKKKKEKVIDLKTIHGKKKKSRKVSVVEKPKKSRRVVTKMGSKLMDNIAALEAADLEKKRAELTEKLGRLSDNDSGDLRVSKESKGKNKTLTKKKKSPQKSRSKSKSKEKEPILPGIVIGLGKDFEELVAAVSEHSLPGLRKDIPEDVISVSSISSSSSFSTPPPLSKKHESRSRSSFNKKEVEVNKKRKSPTSSLSSGEVRSREDPKSRSSSPRRERSPRYRREPRRERVECRRLKHRSKDRIRDRSKEKEKLRLRYRSPSPYRRRRSRSPRRSEESRSHRRSDLPFLHDVYEKLGTSRPPVCPPYYETANPSYQPVVPSALYPAAPSTTKAPDTWHPNPWQPFYAYPGQPHQM